MLDWLIVGGGVHGTLLSHHLIYAGGVPRERLRVLDPHPTPLWCWEHFTRNTGMTCLRSPAVHHLDVDPHALTRFARRVVSGEIELDWETEAGERRQERCDRLVLATGFEPARPGGAWLDAAVAEWGLACAPCGYPRVDRHLQWAPRLHVSGPLAELELGPVSRNIAGARMAAARLTRVARANPAHVPPVPEPRPTQWALQ